MTSSIPLGTAAVVLFIALAVAVNSVAGEWFDQQEPVSLCPKNVPRIRRSWFTLSDDEKSQYQQLLLKMKREMVKFKNDTVGKIPSSLYNYFVDIHNTNPTLWHGTSFFLPPFIVLFHFLTEHRAHRYFLYKFESALRWMARKYGATFNPPIQDPCIVSVPYYPWELDVDLNATDNFLPQECSKLWEGGYLGTFRKNSPDYTLLPPFDAGNWPTLVNTSSCPNISCQSKGNLTNALKRLYNPKMALSYGPAQVTREIVNRKGFANFTSWIEGPHSLIHLWLSFQMQTMASPDDPIFFLHHGNIDRLWAFQQDCHGYDALRPEDLGTNPLYYSNISKFSTTTGAPLSDFSIDGVIPFLWRTRRDSYPIPTAAFPRVRDVWTLGTAAGPNFDDMFVRYGPDHLFGNFTYDICPDKSWTYVNQIPSWLTKRATSDDPSYANSFQRIMDEAMKKIRDAMANGVSSASALDSVAMAECNLTPKREFGPPLVAWVEAQGTRFEQYDRICDQGSIDFYCQGLGKRLNRCQITQVQEEQALGGEGRSTTNVAGIVGIFGGVVMAVAGIVVAAMKYRKGAVKIQQIEKQEEELETFNDYNAMN